AALIVIPTALTRSGFAYKLSASFDDRQQLARLHRLSGLHPDLLYRAVARRRHLVLHLHRLDDEESLAARDGGARLDQDRHHLAGHRRPPLPLPRRAGATGAAAP